MPSSPLSRSEINTLSTELSDRLLKRRVLARQYVFVSTCKLSISLDYVYRPGIGSRRFAIVIKTIEMYSLGMHSVPL